MSDTLEPTIHPLFQNVTKVSEEPTPVFELTSTPLSEISKVESDEGSVPLITVTPFATAVTSQESTAVISSDFITKTVYDDALNSNWVMLDSETLYDTVNSTVDLENIEYAHNGRYSISMTQLDIWNSVYFGVNETAIESYLQDDVYAFNFWINGGDQAIDVGNMVFTFVGSNDYSYWVPGDKSAYFEGDNEFPFSETSFHFLDVEDPIPPNTWVEVELIVREREFDPIYTYITGFYIKSFNNLLSTVYIDDIKIIKYPDIITEETLDNDCVIAPPDDWVLYTIQSGDMVSSLLKQRDFSVDTFLSVNCFSQDVVLSVNQEIWLPSQENSE